MTSEVSINKEAEVPTIITSVALAHRPSCTFHVLHPQSGVHDCSSRVHPFPPEPLAASHHFILSVLPEPADIAPFTFHTFIVLVDGSYWKAASAQKAPALLY